MSEPIRLGEYPRVRRVDERKPPELRFSQRAIEELERIKKHYPNKRAAMLPALWIAQREYGGYLPPEALMEVAYRMGTSYAVVEGVATFYTMYNKRPVGRVMLEVCTNLTCSICGGYEILRYLEEKLGIRVGETTPDGQFTLMEVECLNDCGNAPVMQVGNRYYGNLTLEKIDALLEELKSSEEHTVVQLADTIVQCHLTESERQDIERALARAAQAEEA
ncbi:MAG: NADH-quinone oxidoreductase subunit NuoE [Armatimonadota bacterium]|nr:NADH-quinone oxidoreductase subunit NuoE [Armatimonadota bacterium]MDW8105212.1 NADH-quinone oxidoreductase subunit NuoE [Armatimonadota bacterium]MDW8291282.1 NADH-quinone oxidoreductase subunit NuoE [Armatimonadota bacterium]